MPEGDLHRCALTAQFGERALARLLQELPDAVIVIDARGRLRWANRSAEALFGRSLRDSIGVPGLDLVHPEDLEFALLAMTSVLDKEVGSPIELRLKTTDGWRLVELIGAPISWSEVGAVVLAMRDLTERRRFELAHGHDAQIRSLVQNASAITMLVTPDGVVESVSGALPRLLGQDPELIEGRSLADLVVEADRTALASALRTARQGASAANPVTIPLGLIRRGSTESVLFELSIVNLIDDPTVGGFVVSGHDITARAFAQNEQRKAVSLLTATLEATADGILVIDENGRAASFNRQFAAMWRLPPELVECGGGASVIEFIGRQLVHPAQLTDRIGETGGSDQAESFDVLELTDGRVFERCAKLQRVEGRAAGRVWSFRDMTERKRLEDRLSYQAFHDSLTGLGNRALFRDRLEHAVARIGRTGGNLAVLFLDVDNFKVVNDSLGHSIGDALLKSMAEVLVGCLRKADSAARLGGDEFGVVVEEFKRADEVFELVDRMLVAIRRPLRVDGRDVSATVSIGITFDAPGDTSDHLLSKADLAMYAAKDGGGNRFAAFEQSMLATVTGSR